MNLKEYLPNGFTEFRPHQQEAIEDMINALLNEKEENIILNADVGSGKSLMAYIAAKYCNQEFGMESYILTESKYLQDQYTNDFKELRTCKGRNTFTCLSDDEQDCSKGSCKTMMGFKCPYGVDMTRSFRIAKGTHCPYWEQKTIAMASPISILNNAYALTDFNYIKDFKERDILIIDEAHAIEESIMSFMELTLSLSRIQKDVGYVIEKPNSTSITYFTEELTTIRDLYRDLYHEVRDTSSDKEEVDYLLDKVRSLSRMINFLEKDPTNFVKANDPMSPDKIIFKPIMINNYAQDQLLDLGKQKIFMSGSILKEDVFVEDLGFAQDNYYPIHFPTIIPAKQRPIFERYVGKMGSKNINQTIPNMIDAIMNIVYSPQYEELNGIIHTYTYKVANMLRYDLEDDDRFIFHNGKNREDKIYEFKEEGGILVSPYAYTGVNFPYDECRFGLVIKDPFPYLGDAQIQARDSISNDKYHGYKYTFQRRCATLSQIYGRGVRAADDWCHLYLMDTNIKSLLGQASLLTTYFWEGLVEHDANKEIFVEDETLLSQDKRRSYELERQHEKAVLNAIQNEGLNSLTKLRDAYKALPGSSYVEIEPTWRRLIRNGAIKLGDCIYDTA